MLEIKYNSTELEGSTGTHHDWLEGWIPRDELPENVHVVYEHGWEGEELTHVFYSIVVPILTIEVI